MMFWKLYDFYWFLTDLKWFLNGHFKPFRTIRSIRNEFVASISSSLSPPRAPQAGNPTKNKDFCIIMLKTLLKIMFFDTYKNHINIEIQKIKKNKQIEFIWDDPGCFGGYWGVIPEYFYGIFEGFWKVEKSKTTKNVWGWSGMLWGVLGGHPWVFLRDFWIFLRTW